MQSGTGRSGPGLGPSNPPQNTGYHLAIVFLPENATFGGMVEKMGNRRKVT